ncbi:nucleotidyl transferase AbiEii/AbiGii toxin family protein [Kocuria rhizophila]|uniref:nucleotidyl transferase AbiEii/AbiGii toxin family protein n=1 Tax=Kocuria rhizophila TaxID=72000 RepID=UPI0021A4B72C|nr:nucleotidyl transferase AbiEii/AbiGii toxin family protein [Kocuria rhizophila]MCT1544882.1 nucleotidyl transferase AbiEii/AbiGii toxin family protein [Kocuria rhizophila]MCT2249692.1 nucleotidyl transferase AbiEii/AbiGii toxin family protein [Kocuria rhizophila]
MSELTDWQRRITRLALETISDHGFALAGSGAIREHGVTDRPTEDVDLFTTSMDAAAFDQAVERVIRAWTDNGLDVSLTRQAPLYTQFSLTTTDGYHVDVDMGVDWRGYEPAHLEVGPVLSVRDAIAAKVGAVYSRAEARDFLDLDAIRASGRFNDEQLLHVAAERDPGFDRHIFATQLRQADLWTHAQVASYGMDSSGWAAVQQRCRQWAHNITAPEHTGARHQKPTREQRRTPRNTSTTPNPYGLGGPAVPPTSGSPGADGPSM